MAEQKNKRRQLETRKYVSRKFCPKCGPGICLAKHSNRRSCGKCGYTELVSKQ